MKLDMLRRHLLPPGCVVAMVATIVTQAGCDGLQLDQTAPPCQPGDSACIDKQTEEHPNEPVHDATSYWRVLELGDMQCNRTENNQVINVDNNPYPLSNGQYAMLLCANKLIGIGMNYCNYGRSASAPLVDTWQVMSVDVPGTPSTDTYSVPALEPCHCVSRQLNLPGITAGTWKVASSMPGGNPGGILADKSFLPFQFVVNSPTSPLCQ